MDEPNGSSLVKFTVKELLGEIRDDVRAIDAKLDTKADTVALEDLRVRIGVLEVQHTRSDAEKAYRRWLVFGGPFVVIIATISLVLSAFNVF